jgi:hypothetical protein
MSKPITEENRKDFEEKAKSCVEFAKFSLKLFNDVVLANKTYLDLILGNIYTMKSYYMGLVDSKNKVNFYEGDIRVVDQDGKEVAKDEWNRSYTLAPDGQVEVVNVNGTIVATPADGAQVEIRAERKAGASSQEAANDLLKRVEIRESVTPAKVRLETKAPPMLGGHVQVKEGPFRTETAVHKVEYETMGLMGSNLMLDDAEALIRINDLCNRYGIDIVFCHIGLFQCLNNDLIYLFNMCT